MIYNITIYTDMGHLMTNPSYSSIPKDIYDFIFSKIKIYTCCATDKLNLGCLFHILKTGLNKRWTYYYNNDIIHITYDLDTFDPKTMKILQ